MSKKTVAIYNCLAKLESLAQDLEILANTEENDKNLNDTSFQMKQELKTLRFWLDSLYKYNGTSTSLVKKRSSANNGKKGGRPPKEISILKKKIIQLEEEKIPEIEHKIVMADSNEELESLKEEREKCFNELIESRHKISQWNLSKKTE